MNNNYVIISPRSNTTYNTYTRARDGRQPRKSRARLHIRGRINRKFHSVATNEFLNSLSLCPPPIAKRCRSYLKNHDSKTRGGKKIAFVWIHKKEREGEREREKARPVNEFHFQPPARAVARARGGVIVRDSDRPRSKEILIYRSQYFRRFNLIGRIGLLLKIVATRNNGGWKMARNGMKKKKKWIHSRSKVLGYLCFQRSCVNL